MVILNTHNPRYFYFRSLICASLLYFILCNIHERTNEDGSHVEVRAVFIDCELDERKDVTCDSDNSRFQREELFKHNILRECKKKLALTVKMISEPGKSSGDEYIPIEHVFDGSKKKRVRLLDPFVLRLRREEPLQAYKIRRIDTVSGILTNSDDHAFQEINKNMLERKKRGLETYFIRDSNAGRDMLKASSYFDANAFACRANNATLTKRIRRQKKMTKIESFNKEYVSPWCRHKNHLFNVQGREVRDIFKKGRKHGTSSKKETQRQSYNEKHTGFDYDPSRFADKKYVNNYLKKGDFNKKLNVELFDPYKLQTQHPAATLHRIISKENQIEKEEETTSEYFDVKETEKHFAVYEIGSPDLWYTVHVQLYEKLSTPEGKTIWNDITKNEVASVSTLHPEWNNEDMSIRYRLAKWVSRDEFYLPKVRLYLLVPIRDTNVNDQTNYAESIIDKFGEYLVVSSEDVITVNDPKKDEIGISSPATNISQRKAPRRVLVRGSRAFMGGVAENLIFASRGSDQYMMIPHRRPHHSQIDVESRADENQLVRIGSSGRIMTAVSDNTRRTRTVLTLQVTNTGLAAARFRVTARDCGPGLLNQINKDSTQEFMIGPVLLPPKHTHRFQLELPFEILGDVTHCSDVDVEDAVIQDGHDGQEVSLLNDDDESVAVRGVAIKKDDRCFCVWHCDCVCLSDDPKLICREMTESRQIAAGLSLLERPRHVRSVCYPDDVTLNTVVIVIGVLAALLTLGLIKAVLGLGLRCIASWGLERILKMPRKLEHYYESSLRYRPVIYDNEGWPVHPDTMKRSIRYISKYMEFVLNLIFFITIPCVIVCDALRFLISKCRNSNETVQPKSKPTDIDKNEYSSQELQVSNQHSKRRCQTLRKWMKSQADELSSDIWQKGLSIQEATEFNYVSVLKSFMRPLLREECLQKSEDLLSSYADSEQDDTEYVLMQMQKSRESLAKSQRKFTDASSKSHWNDDNIIPSTSKR